MRQHVVLPIAFLLCLCPGVRAADPPTTWTPELQMATRAIGEVVPSPDGSWAAYTVTEAVMEEEKSEMLTHIFLARGDGSDRFQLTHGERSATSPAFSTDGRYVYFRSSRSSDPEKKRTQLWRIATRGGEAERLTDWKGEVGGYRVSPDGKWIAFAGRPEDPDKEKAKKEKLDFRVVDEDPKSHAIWIIPAEGAAPREPRRLFEASFHVDGFEWSPDSRRIVLERWPRPEPDYFLEADILEVEVESGKLTEIAATEVPESSPHYSPDGKSIAFVKGTDKKRWAGEGRIVLHNRANAEQKLLPDTKDEFGRGTRLLGFSADSQRILFTETDGVSNVVRAMSPTGKIETVYRPDGTLSSYGGGSRLNTAGSVLGLVKESWDKAPEAYVTPLGNIRPVQISQANERLPKLPLGRTEAVRWKASDGLDVEGLLTYPVGYERGQKVPLVLVIHGGPMGVFTDQFIGARGLYPVASFAAEGYAVLRPNPRGSSGYGKSFRFANYSDWGGGDYRDIMAGVDHVIEMGVADPDRMAVMGWSYGGFMTSWVLTHTDRFKAACVGAAVTNLWSFTGTADIPGFLPDYFDGEPWENFEAYRDHSPMSFVKGVTTPTLILHGEADDRVPVSQGYELYNALKRQGVTVKMVVYPRTPHGPAEPKFLLDVARRHLDWIKKYVP